MSQGTTSVVPTWPSFLFVIPTEPAAAGEWRDLLFARITNPARASSRPLDCVSFVRYANELTPLGVTQ